MRKAYFNRVDTIVSRETFLLVFSIQSQFAVELLVRGLHDISLGTETDSYI